MKKATIVFILIFFSFINVYSQGCSPDGCRRELVMNTTAAPYNAILLLSIERPRGRTFQASGFLIAPRIILTAAHNIKRFNMFSYPKKITVTPGANYSNLKGAPFGTFSFARREFMTRTNRGYKGNSTRRNDYGIIILPNDSIFNRVKNLLPIKDFDEARSDFDTLWVAGYPGDKKYGTQWSESCNSFQDKEGLLIYDLFTFTGLSGAPLFYKSKTGGRYFAVGIHNTGKLNGTNGCNAATEIDATTRSILLKWLAEYQ